MGDEGFVALRSRCVGRGFKPPRAALVDDRRGERRGKGAGHASGRDQEGERERIVADVSKETQMASKPGRLVCSGMSLAGAHRLARRCPACRRREPDLRLPCGTGEGAFRRCPLRWATGRSAAVRSVGRRRRESTVAGRAGGPARSSGEGLVIRLERRGRVIRGDVRSINSGAAGGGVAWTS